MGSSFRHSVEFSTSFSNSYFPISKNKEQKCTANSSSIKSQDDISLVLGLGQSSHSCISTFPMKLNEQNSLNLDQDLKYSTSNEGIVRHNNLFGYTTKPKLDLELSLSTSYAESDISPSSQEISSFRNFTCSPLCATPFSNAYSRVNTHHINPILSQATVNALPSSVPGTSGITHQQPKRKPGVKTCQFEGCRKGARGAKGLCISHGGGARCQRNGCLRGAEGKPGFCKAHGGGRRCQRLGCTKSAEGRTDYCIRHGGGRRCSQEGCGRASRGKSGLCIRHGGGKRCTVEGCSKCAEGVSRKCISHGGGRRCQYPGCTKGAQGSAMLCKAHGGGKRCTFLGCMRGAEGSTQLCKGHGGGKRCTHEGGCNKSVHGGTSFCVRHGGGKRCNVIGCTKSARGRTSCCVRHGGGKRCKHEGCVNSAQGSTIFCKSHGGGKRCSWKDESGVSCERSARGRFGLCSSHSSQVKDDQMTVGHSLWNPHSSILEEMKGLQQDESIYCVGNNSSSVDFSLPEGRVHGGNLMEFLLEKTGFGISGSDQVAGGSSDRGKSQILPHWWV